MKVGVWMKDDREALYDVNTDELVIRTRPPGTGWGEAEVDRIPMKDILRIRKAWKIPKEERDALAKKLRKVSRL